MTEIEKLKGGRKATRREFNEVESIFQQKYAEADADTQAKIDGLMKSSQNFSTANQMNSRTLRDYQTEIYKRAIGIMDGEDTPSYSAAAPTMNYFGGYSHSESSQNADNVTRRYMSHAQSGGGATGGGGGSTPSNGSKYYYKWSSGLSSDWGFLGDSLEERMNAFAATLERNLRNAYNAKNEGKTIYGISEEDLETALVSLRGKTWNKNNFKQLAQIAQIAGVSAGGFSAYFGDLIPGQDAKSQKKRQIMSETGYKDIDISSMSDWAKSIIKNKGYNLLQDDDGNVFVYDNNWNKAGAYSDINTDSGDFYGHGFFVDENGQLGYTDGNLKKGDRLYDPYTSLQTQMSNQDNGTIASKYHTFSLNKFDFSDNDLVKTVIQDVGRDNKANIADVSALFSGNNQIIAYTENGYQIPIGRFGEINFSDPNILFAYKKSNGEIVTGKTYNDIKSAFGDANKFGFDETIGQVGKYSDNDAMMNQMFSEADTLSSDTSTRIVKSTIDHIKNFFENPSWDAFWGFLAAPKAYTSWGSSLVYDKTIGEDPAEFIMILLDALENQDENVDIPGMNVTGKKFIAELTKNDPDAINKLLATAGKYIQNGTVKLSDDQLMRFNKFVRDAYYYKHQKKTGGKISFAKEGQPIFTISEKRNADELTGKVLDNLSDLEELKSKADAEGKTVSQYEASKNTKLTAADTMRIASIGADIVSIAASFTGVGAAVAEAAGIASFVGNTAADLIDPSVSGWELAKNTAIGAGLAAISFIPGAKIPSTLRKVVKIAPKLMMAAGAMGIAFDESTHETFKKIANGQEKLNTEDWRNLAMAFQLVSGGTRGGRRAFEKHKAKNNKNFYKAAKGESIDVYDGDKKIGSLTTKEQQQAYNKALEFVKNGKSEEAQAELVKTGLFQNNEEAAKFINTSEGFFDRIKLLGKKGELTTTTKESNAEFDYEAIYKAYEKAGEDKNISFFGRGKDRPTWEQQGIIDATGIDPNKFNGGITNQLRSKIKYAENATEEQKAQANAALTDLTKSEQSIVDDVTNVNKDRVGLERHRSAIKRFDSEFNEANKKIQTIEQEIKAANEQLIEIERQIKTSGLTKTGLRRKIKGIEKTKLEIQSKITEAESQIETLKKASEAKKVASPSKRIRRTSEQVQLEKKVKEYKQQISNLDEEIGKINKQIQDHDEFYIPDLKQKRSQGLPDHIKILEGKRRLAEEEAELAILKSQQARESFRNAGRDLREKHRGLAELRRDAAQNGKMRSAIITGQTKYEQQFTLDNGNRIILPKGTNVESYEHLSNPEIQIANKINSLRRIPVEEIKEVMKIDTLRGAGVTGDGKLYIWKQGGQINQKYSHLRK